MKIILVGGGKVGFALCRSLVAEKHDVLLIEQDEAVLNHIGLFVNCSGLKSAKLEKGQILSFLF